MAPDTRAVPLTVASNDGLRRVVGRVLVGRDQKAYSILIDDPEVATTLAKEYGFAEGSYQIEEK